MSQILFDSKFGLNKVDFILFQFVDNCKFGLSKQFVFEIAIYVQSIISIFSWINSLLKIIAQARILFLRNKNLLSIRTKKQIQKSISCVQYRVNGKHFNKMLGYRYFNYYVG